MPAKAGIQRTYEFVVSSDSDWLRNALDSRLRGNDGLGVSAVNRGSLNSFYELIRLRAVSSDNIMKHKLTFHMASRLLGFLALALFAHSEARAESGMGRNKKLYVVPAPANVVIDGKLDDWDWSGHILSYAQSEAKASQSAEFAVMCDDKALYVGAKVRDTSPMLNRNSPAANADKAWMGDCTQFRLTTDRTQPFPTNVGSLGKEDQKGIEAGQPIHLTLWYYSDERLPALQLFKSMAYQPAREAWQPKGVVPQDQYQAKYVSNPDGSGYSYEYRIPWETLNAGDKHPLAGDVVTSTVQFLWGDGSGLVNTASAYDLMSKPGFPWQDTTCWGKLIFYPSGSIPRQWVEPRQQTEAPRPLSFKYQLPASGEVSVALYDGEGRIVRHLEAQAPHTAGAVEVKWDGLDAGGKALPAGTYNWKGLYHEPLRTRYVMSLGNSGQPAWKNAEGTGGWGGDYGPPHAAAVAGDTVILAWMGHEAGWGIIGTDLSGKKKWGIRHKNAQYLATDGVRFFAPNEDAPACEVNVFSVKDGQPLAFGNGRLGLEPPAGGDKASNRPTGVAWSAGKLYVSFGKRNLIAVYAGDPGDLQTTWEVPSPGRLAVLSDGSVLVISSEAVLKLTGGKGAPFLTSNLDKPSGVAVDSSGLIYVSNGGARQNVSVFDVKGRYRRSIGRQGGRPVLGKFDPGGMREPAGIAVDSKGNLWVPEAVSPLKRLSIWNTASGKLAREFFGACSYSPFAWVDPSNPREAFFDNTIWNIDLEKGSWYPKSIFYAYSGPNSVQPVDGGFYWPFRVFTAKNGRQYAVSWVRAFGSVIWIREDDFFKPLYFLFRNRPNPVLTNFPPFSVMDDIKKYPAGGVYVWADTSKDGQAQQGEITELPKDSPFQYTWMDNDLNLYGEGKILQLSSLGGDGIPQYDFKAPRTLIGGSGPTWADPTGKEIFTWREGLWFGRVGEGGKFAWQYPNLKNWHSTINEGITKPGTMSGVTCPLGMAGRYTGLVSYFGTVELVRDDGLYVGQVFESNAKGNSGPNIFYVEFLAGQMFQLKESGRTYIVAGDQDARFTEVQGLDTVKNLAGRTYELTAAQVQEAAKAQADHEAARQVGIPLVIARGGQVGVLLADPAGKTVDEKRSFTVQASYDAGNLYFRYNVTSPAPLVNGIPDPLTVYKGGNLLDIQLEGDPAADPKRTKPALGDLRLLVSRREGNTHAVLLRPHIKGFTGEPIVLSSTTGTETFDSIAITDKVELRDYQPTKNGFTVTLVVPLEVAGLPPLKPGQEVRLDAGYIFGDAGGVNAAVRAYWHNNSFTANVVNDIPHESRLEPAQWGIARVE